VREGNLTILPAVPTAKILLNGNKIDGGKPTFLEVGDQVIMEGSPHSFVVQHFDKKRKVSMHSSALLTPKKDERDEDSVNEKLAVKKEDKKSSDDKVDKKEEKSLEKKVGKVDRKEERTVEKNEERDKKITVK